MRVLGGELEYDDEGNPEKPAQKLEAENQELRRELASLRNQRDILKKALSIFSQTNNGESNS